MERFEVPRFNKIIYFNINVYGYKCEVLIKYFFVDSTVANPEIIKNIASQGTSSSSGNASGPEYAAVMENPTESIEITSGSLLYVNIRLLTGKICKINAYSLWTVDMLRRKLMKLLGKDYKPITLYYRAEKLQDENTLQSLNILNGMQTLQNFTNIYLVP